MAGGCRVTSLCIPDHRDVTLLPLLTPMVKRGVANQHANFKEFCEAQTS